MEDGEKLGASGECEHFVRQSQHSLACSTSCSKNACCAEGIQSPDAVVYREEWLRARADMKRGGELQEGSLQLLRGEVRLAQAGLDN